MVLAALRLPLPRALRAAAAAAAAAAPPLWSVDVLQLLLAAGARATLHTAFAGANPAHAALPYYAAQPAADAAARVPRAFAAAGAAVRLGAVPLAALAARLAARAALFVVLLDARLLPPCAAATAARAAPEAEAGGAGGYRGHFAVVAGVDLGRGEVALLDPACTGHGVCIVSAAAFDAARSAAGTDDDVIEIECA